MGLTLRHTADAGLPPMSMTTASGTTTRLKHWVAFRANVEGIKRSVWAFACPTEKGNLSLLLGLPFLNDVNAVIGIREGTITIGDPELSEQPITLKTPAIPSTARSVSFDAQQLEQMLEAAANVSDGESDEEEEQDDGDDDAEYSAEDDATESDGESVDEDFQARVKKLLTEKEWHLRNFAIAGLETGVYEYCVVANGELSRWGANAVLVTKPGEAVPRLTFNYHYVHKEPAGSQMTLMQQNHDFLSRLTHQVYSSFDLKNGYWAVEIHPEDRHYLAFTVPALGQLQPTRMAQGARSSAHTMNELGLLAFGAIPPPQPEKSFLHAPTPKDLPDMSFYIDDLSAAHSDWEKH
ncbi:unnamed protein product [Zymoseptoria tritici ST99CH_1A5]|uniref:Reverse transcriptase domain-containing protein n=1 Tax=Zymoseptoria tritici ST99CH_1A5 TaxID=1276529 RepID=A0A1Y6M181_ZYMTR|nr:unnamed protein product [Zymoseptoria tritici ST99CH_1A5]